jgi:hypothetical protein
MPVIDAVVSPVSLASSPAVRGPRWSSCRHCMSEGLTPSASAATWFIRMARCVVRWMPSTTSRYNFARSLDIRHLRLAT